MFVYFKTKKYKKFKTVAKTAKIIPTIFHENSGYHQSPIASLAELENDREKIPAITVIRRTSINILMV